MGHGTLSADQFVVVAGEAGVDEIVDIRRFPGSRRHPQFGRDAMERWLTERGIGYRWIPALGGRRTPVASSPNLGLRNEQFRAYADYMASDAFRRGVAELLVSAGDRGTAVMCAESVWWRCHRRLLADHLVLLDGTPVEHLFHDGRVAVHVPTPEARRVGDHLVYEPVSPRPS
jgi:uncharacterized protein (DUF488 family)